jgi:hypothetical protein
MVFIFHGTARFKGYGGSRFSSDERNRALIELEIILPRCLINRNILMNRSIALACLLAFAWGVSICPAAAQYALTDLANRTGTPGFPAPPHVTLVAVPEPSTTAMFGVGLAGAGLLRYLRWRSNRR